MTPTVYSWFYTSPGNNAYQIAERVRLTLWDARLGQIWLDVVNAESPYKMEGNYGGRPVEIEWVPAKTFRLGVKPALPSLADSFSAVLRLRPTLKYEDARGFTNWEWHLAGGDERWREIAGNPVYQNPVRLNAGSGRTR